MSRQNELQQPKLRRDSPVRLPHTSMSCACEELLDKKKKKKSPLTQSSDRSGLSGEDEIIYKLRFNVPVSFFLQLPPPHLLSLSSK